MKTFIAIVAFILTFGAAYADEPGPLVPIPAPVQFAPPGGRFYTFHHGQFWPAPCPVWHPLCHPIQIVTPGAGLAIPDLPESAPIYVPPGAAMPPPPGSVPFPPRDY